MKNLTSLDAIGVANNTDKSSLYHDYLRKYEKYLPFNRADELNILEIGVLQGASLKTWSQYYTNSTVLGIDIDEKCKSLETQKIKIEIGSQNDLFFLEKVCNKYGPFDLIVDDGSHLNQDVITSFKFLFDFLKNDRIYIVEDVVTSYWREHNGGYKKYDAMVEFFKNIIDEVNFFGDKLNSANYCQRKDELLLKQFDKQNFIGKNIESINFLNSIIIINKR